jgi:naphthoate synthase
MGMVNAVIPHAELEDTALNGHRNFRKVTNANQNVEVCMNLTDDRWSGNRFFGEATRLAYMTRRSQRRKKCIS